GGYCLEKKEPVSSLLLLAVMLTRKSRSARGRTENQFVDSIEKQLKERERFSTTGNFLNLPGDLHDYFESAKEIDQAPEGVSLTKELVTTLEIALQIAD